MSRVYGRTGSQSDYQRQPRQHASPSASHGQKRPYPKAPPVRDAGHTASIVKTRAFKLLVDTAGAENIALALDSNLARIAELTSGERFTPETAFHMEMTLGLPDGYFDNANPVLAPDVIARLKSPLDHKTHETTEEFAETMRLDASATQPTAPVTVTNATFAEDIEMPRNKSAAVGPVTAKTRGSAATKQAPAAEIGQHKKGHRQHKGDSQQTHEPANTPSLYEIRRANLHVLTSRNGSKARLAHLLDLSQSNMAHRLHGQKRMDDAETNRVVVALGLSSDWLDQPHEPGGVPEAVLNLLAPASRGRKSSLADSPVKQFKTKPVPSKRSAVSATNALQDEALRKVPQPSSKTQSDTSMRPIVTDANVAPEAPKEVSSAGILTAHDVFPSTASTDLGALRGIHPIAEALLKTLAGKARTGRLDEMKALELLHQALSL